MPLKETGWARAKYILKYCDSECNELMVGAIHAFVLPFAMFELGKPWVALQIFAAIAGLFQVWAALYNGRLFMRKYAVQAACVISLATVANYTVADMMHGSQLGWLVLCAMTIWNLYRVTNEQMFRRN